MPENAGAGMHDALDTKAHRIAARLSPTKTAILTTDVEHDYNGNRTDALDRLPEVLAAVRAANVPLTAFVEGRLFRQRPDLCTRLAEFGADLQLHCHDHREPGDDAESLSRGIDAFASFTGARPRGYRAHTYRLGEALLAAVVAEGFHWDSSILPGFGLGNHAGRTFRHGDWFLIDDVLAEYPVASWRAFGVPFTHSYRQLMGRLAESMLSRAASLPSLLVYDMHMVDLVPDGRIRQSPLPTWLKGAHALARRRQRGLEELTLLADWLRGCEYEWSTLAAYHERVGVGRRCR